MKSICFTILLLPTFIFIAACNRSASGNDGNADSSISGNLIIFHAGSLSVPLKEISEEFNKLYPDVKILKEAAGSLASARKITELGQNCDIIALADYKIIDLLLIPQYCQWNIPFAGNEMIIAYTNGSKYASEINAGNWFEVLARKEVGFGRSDPNSDPCGYRSVMTMQLADIFYGKEISKSLLRKDLKYIRPKETDLLALLETRELDYIFIYRSVAIQHQLNYLVLPDSVNLKNPGLSNFYTKARLEVTGQAPEQKQLMIGEPMVYGVSMPTKAPNKKAAEAFLLFMLDPQKGLKIMERNGQQPLPATKNENFEKIPASIQKFVLLQ
jgi:molybdate/tungstate transport system substrate-binding protein